MLKRLPVAALLTVFSLSLLGDARASLDFDKRLLVNETCTQIAAAISPASNVYLIGTPLYLKDISHWASSSSQASACSVEPGTAEDVSTIIKILANTSTPFAVKGGGHASNPGFSSTPGVQIAMYRFSEVTYDASAQTAKIGTGLVWDDVYAALEQYNVNVVGGRVSGVGVAGFTLGGGYSWKTNQYGLTVDTAVSFDLVLPNGTFTTVTESSDEDLFWALKGGFNNFGIVTAFTLKTYPQTQVWGGLITYAFPELDAVSNATANFQQYVTDPKAGIITTYNYLLEQPGVSQLIFYDAPEQPEGIFDEFLAIPSVTRDVSTRSFLSFVQASPANATTGTRAIFNTVSLTNITKSLLDVVVNETTVQGAALSLQSGAFISYDVEPFLPSLFTHSTSPSAYPPDRSRGLLPMNMYYAYASEVFDESFYDTIRSSAARITAAAEAEGQDIGDATLYGNYAIFDTPLERIYRSNLPRLRAIKSQVDPNNVMGLAGGWKF